MSALRPRLSTKTVLLTLALLAPLACQGTKDQRVVQGGARVGLTMGALPSGTGRAGGGSGSISDLENNRTDEAADAVAVPASAEGWARLDDLVGNWRCSIWGLDAERKRITAAATWTGQLIGTSAVQLRMLSFDAKGFGDDFDAQFGGFSQLSYAADTGYELLNVFSATPEDQRWVGQRASGEERYSFFHAGSSDGAVLGSRRTGTRIELRFVGRDVFLIDTYVSRGNGEEQIQSYRFTRTP